MKTVWKMPCALCTKLSGWRTNLPHTVAITVAPSVRSFIPKLLIRAWASKLLKDRFNSKLEPQYLSICLVGDTEIKVWNRDYRGKDKPTDVLSFAMREGETIGQVTVLGDIVISLETAARQARAHRRSLEREAKMLLIHGFCHLLGYDHQTDSEEAIMKKEERRLAKLCF